MEVLTHGGEGVGVEVDEGGRGRAPDSASTPSAPAAAEQVDHVQALHAAREPRMSKMARTRSDVGRTDRGSLAASRRPPLRPPMTRIRTTIRPV